MKTTLRLDAPRLVQLATVVIASSRSPIQELKFVLVDQRYLKLLMCPTSNRIRDVTDNQLHIKGTMNIVANFGNYKLVILFKSRIKIALTLVSGRKQGESRRYSVTDSTMWSTQDLPIYWRHTSWSHSTPIYNRFKITTRKIGPHLDQNRIIPLQILGSGRSDLVNPLWWFNTGYDPLSPNVQHKPNTASNEPVEMKIDDAADSVAQYKIILKNTNIRRHQLQSMP